MASGSEAEARKKGHRTLPYQWRPGVAVKSLEVKLTTRAKGGMEDLTLLTEGLSFALELGQDTQSSPDVATWPGWRPEMEHCVFTHDLLSLLLDTDWMSGCWSMALVFICCYIA